MDQNLFQHSFTPNKKQEAAIMCFLRKQRFIGGYCIDQNILELVSSYFQDLKSLHKYGLKIHYEKLKKTVIDNNIIGVILYGANLDKNKDVIINTYTTQDQKKIVLTIKSICINLINDFIKKENLDGLCEKSPNFKIYYKE